MAGTKFSPRQRDTILVAEDEFQMQELIKDILEEKGFTVLVATSGREAVDLFTKYKTNIAVVVLDVMLPELDGRETYFAIREIDQSAKVLFCSGYTALVEIQSLLEKYNLHAIQKPFDPEEFLALIEEVMND
jgi:two-component system, cell cycle sensor histidine kinase and response regulator CckA